MKQCQNLYENLFYSFSHCHQDKRWGKKGRLKNFHFVIINEIIYYIQIKLSNTKLKKKYSIILKSTLDYNILPKEEE